MRSCSVKQLLGGRHVAVAQFFHDGFVGEDNGRLICLYERKTVL